MKPEEIKRYEEALRKEIKRNDIVLLLSDYQRYRVVLAEKEYLILETEFIQEPRKVFKESYANVVKVPGA